MTRWDRVKIYFNGFSLEQQISRKDYLSTMGDREEALDEYRCVLQKGGYLKRTTPGCYQRLKEIPAELTLGQARATAYPPKPKRLTKYVRDRMLREGKTLG